MLARIVVEPTKLSWVDCIAVYPLDSLETQGGTHNQNGPILDKIGVDFRPGGCVPDSECDTVLHTAPRSRFHGI